MASVFFLDKFQKNIVSYDTSDMLACVQTQEITTNANELINDTLSIEMKYNELVKESKYILMSDKKVRMYRILEVSEQGDVITFECANFAIDELDNFIVKDIRVRDKNIKDVLQQILDDSESPWVIGECTSNLNIKGNFYYISVKEALKSLQEQGCEFDFEVEIEGNSIARKIINCYPKIGKDNYRRFEYGEDVLKIVQKQDRTNIVTAIIGRGKGEEVGDGYGRRLEFKDVEWKKENGKPLDKPKGQNYLEFPEMTQEHGIPNNGHMLPRKAVVIFEDIEDPNELLQKTYETLEYYSRPLVQFSTEVLGSDSIGNIVSIHRGDRGYHYKTRVFKVVTDYVNGNVSSGLGDNLTSNQAINRQISNVQSNISSLEDKKMTFYQSTEIGKYQDDIMRGAGKNGGSVYWVNGLEAGVSNSREVYEVVFMDGPTIAESQNFLVQNNSGISFKQCQKGEWKSIQDVHNGASDTAWTLDGTFNANFIRAGKIRADIFETSFNDVGDQLKLVAGALRAVNGNSKIMELTKKGLEFWSGDKAIGTMGTAGEPFPDLQDQDGPVTMDGEAVMITTNDDGEYIAISAQTGRGIILGKSKGIYIIDPNVRIVGDVTISGNLDVTQTLKIKGQQIYPDGSGGSSPGPSEDGATYEPKNIASNIANNTNIKNWLEKYTKQYGIEEYIGLAYALIMVENADTDGTDDIMQSSESAGYPGPGYLTGEASVKQGCKHLAEVLKSSFAKNVDVWGAMQSYNFGSAYVDWLASRGGKNTTDLAEQYSRDVVAPSLGNTTGTTYSYVNAVSQADGRTYLYDNGGNFHYAAMIRQYVTVTEGTTDNWAIPIAKPLTVTSEFGWRTSPISGAQELHNGIDLVNGNGTTPIYAAGAGEVVVSMFEQSYGNYIVIKHANGIYTGYAHQSKRLVSAGDTVKRGQQIGNMGSTGDSTGAHLHFQFFRNGPWPQDWPNDFINPRDMMQF